MAGPLSNTKQEAFCQEYAKDKNKSEAGRRAGYSDDYGRVLYTKSHVRARCDELIGSLARRNDVDADVVIQGLLTEAQGNGKDTNSAARVSAWDKLGKHFGIYGEDNKQKVPEAVTGIFFNTPPPGGTDVED